MNEQKYEYKCNMCGVSFPALESAPTMTPTPCDNSGCSGTVFLRPTPLTHAPPTPPTTAAEMRKGLKPSLTMLAPRFLVALADHMRKGLKDGRKRDDWKKLVWDEKTETMYRDALLRHALIDFDPVAIACNCMIIWYHDHKEKNQG